MHVSVVLHVVLSLGSNLWVDRRRVPPGPLTADESALFQPHRRSLLFIFGKRGAEKIDARLEELAWLRITPIVDKFVEPTKVYIS
ncbi:hypothetical protein AES38_15220 (plasmid) [Clavibacter capsici]|nr:hypothetical protein AES38_15220 [Clavibacter capsici]